MIFNSNKEIKAFTLAEVLITLGIIGVVAALTIPALIGKFQDLQYKSAYKKVFSEINQAYKMAVQENGGGFGAYNPNNNTQSVVKFNALKSQFKVVNECAYNTASNGVCWSSSGVGLKGANVLSCGQLSNDGKQFVNAGFVTASGVFYALYSYTATDAIDWVLVDTNGNQGPNDWGKDAYVLGLRDIDVIPASSACGGNLKHNDGTTVDMYIEFVNALIK